MTLFTTFYLSRILGRKVYNANGSPIGVVKDLLIRYDASSNSLSHPDVCGVKIKAKNIISIYSFRSFRIEKEKGRMRVTCDALEELLPEVVENNLFLSDTFLDKQIVDLNGRKLVRVNDVRLVSLSIGSYVVAVDIGVEGLLRRIGIAKPLKYFFSLFNVAIPSKFILWEDVEAVDFSNFNIRLSKSQTKLQTLHPSDLADIIEDLGKKASTDVFAVLDEEKAADVLEELEPDAQVHILESLSIEKAADVLEKMPADEVADILDVLEKEKAEQLLNEMDKSSSEEVRELLGYPLNTVGSIMSTDVLSFNSEFTIEEVLCDIRGRKPENEELYSLFVTNENDQLVATFSLRDIVISEPETMVKDIMKPSPVYLYDYQKLDDIAELISKYNLLAIPVVDSDEILQGMVVIDDVIDDLMDKRKTHK